MGFVAQQDGSIGNRESLAGKVMCSGWWLLIVIETRWSSKSKSSFTFVYAFLNNMTVSRYFFFFYKCSLKSFSDNMSLLWALCIPPQTKGCTSISSDLWTISYVHTSSLQIYKHNPWPKGRLLSATTCLAIGISVSFWIGMDPQRMPDASRLYLTLPQRASFAPSHPVSGSGPSVPPHPSLSTGWFVTIKPPFSEAVSTLFYCYCPQAQWVLSAPLAPSLPSAERRHLSDGAIFSRLAKLLIPSMFKCLENQMSFILHDWVGFA